MRIVLAYSGGLDTTVAIAWLKERYNAEIIAVTVDVGQKEDFDAIEQRAYAAGASKFYLIDAKKEFVDKYIKKAILANALYEDQYPLGTALARPLIAEKVLEVARREGADGIAHGATSKGNDQIRFEAIFRTLAPELKIIAPIREWGMSRREEIEYAKRKGIPVDEKSKRYSIDDNLWSRSIEGSELEDPFTEPPYEAFEWVKDPKESPDEPLYLEVEFKKGIPIRVNEIGGDLLTIISILNKIAGEYGYGIIDMIENRVIGLKSREVYEAPAALTIITAKKDLEKLILSKREWRFKRNIDFVWADMVYEGLWLDPLKLNLDMLEERLNEHISGVVKLKLYKGSLRVVGRKSENASYMKELISYDLSWFPSDEEARGFIEAWLMDSISSFRSRYLNARPSI